MHAYNDVVPILESLKRQHHPSATKIRSHSRPKRDLPAKEVASELKQNARNLKKLDFSEIDRYMNEMLK